MTRNSTSTRFFEEKYQSEVDPWRFTSSPYEQSRYQSMLKALGNRRYKRAFEPGCSIGVFTAYLAERCDEVQAIDVSPTAVTKAQARCAGLTNVHVACGMLPADVPGGMFDLIVFSEVGYYFEQDVLSRLMASLVEQLSPLGTLLAVHWLGVSQDHVLSGDRVHEIVSVTKGLTHEHSERHTGFRMDRWRRG